MPEPEILRINKKADWYTIPLNIPTLVFYRDTLNLIVRTPSKFHGIFLPDWGPDALDPGLDPEESIT